MNDGGCGSDKGCELKVDAAMATSISGIAHVETLYGAHHFFARIISRGYCRTPVCIFSHSCCIHSLRSSSVLPAVIIVCGGVSSNCAVYLLQITIPPTIY
jgi:hypothetical protein